MSNYPKRLIEVDLPIKRISAHARHSQRLLAYVGKTGKGDYKPFCFNQALMTTDIEFSEEMFLITRETAEAYLKSKTIPVVTPPKPEELGKEPATPPQEPDGKSSPSRRSRNN